MAARLHELASSCARWLCKTYKPKKYPTATTEKREKLHDSFLPVYVWERCLVSAELETGAGELAFASLVALLTDGLSDHGHNGEEAESRHALCLEKALLPRVCPELDPWRDLAIPPGLSFPCPSVVGAPVALQWTGMP